MAVPAIARYTLTERPYDLWLKGELLEQLGIRDDKRTRVEIIGGEIVVSPGPLFHHARIATDIQKAFHLKEGVTPDFPWQAVQVMDFDLRHIGDGYIPDLIVLPTEVYNAPATQDARHLIDTQIGMAVEITPKSTASYDRMPEGESERWTKWKGYAHEGVGFYLLVDRAPDKRCVTLYSEPDLPDGVYDDAKTWKFGEAIVLPEPFGVEIPTGTWRPWEK